MNDKQIEAFLMIAEMGSMNRAAEKLYISQPALKKRMDTLEAELGVTLLQRDSGGCTLTQAGQLFMKEVNPIYTQFLAVVEKIQRVKKQQVLRMCAMPDISMREQDEMLIAFMRENPDVIAKSVPLPTSQWFDAIADGRADLCSGFCVKGKLEAYTERKLHFNPRPRKGKAVCVVASKHPLAKKKRIEPEELVGYSVYAGPLLYHDSGLREFAQSRGIDLQCDESAGKRYEMINRCEEGAVYIHPKSYSEDLRPLAVIPFSGFLIYAGWVYADDSRGLVERFLRFYETSC